MKSYEFAYQQESAFLPAVVRHFISNRVREAMGLLFLGLAIFSWIALQTYDPTDPSWNTQVEGAMVHNFFDASGAWLADCLFQTWGLLSYLVPPVFLSWAFLWVRRRPNVPLIRQTILLMFGLSSLSIGWALGKLGVGLSLKSLGFVGVITATELSHFLNRVHVGWLTWGVATACLVFGAFCWVASVGLRRQDWMAMGTGMLRFGHLLVPVFRSALRTAIWVVQWMVQLGRILRTSVAGSNAEMTPRTQAQGARIMPRFDTQAQETEAMAYEPSAAEEDRDMMWERPDEPAPFPPSGRAPVIEAPWEDEPFDEPLPLPQEPEKERLFDRLKRLPGKMAAEPSAARKAPSKTKKASSATSLLHLRSESYQLPSLDLLQEPSPKDAAGTELSRATLEKQCEKLGKVLLDYGVKGRILRARPGPVVTLFEFEPAPGIKTSRVIGLADDIARSMSALSARISIIAGQSEIGIELPNERRQSVSLHELISCPDFEREGLKLTIALGKNISGQPVFADLARMPHMIVAGTTGSGKSVAVNAMILSLLYRHGPETCRFIMIDPKMLELSIYNGIPHLLTPVVTDPKKAIFALKWTVKEMENRYRAMSHLGVRNVESYNFTIQKAKAEERQLTRRVQTGFDPETGHPQFEDQLIDMTPLPYIVVVVDEMADLMMVAGKDIEAAVQRLAQMARAAGIHVVMATQRPSVDVITGTIKANFPTRMSFQVASKFDSKTILGEQGAEQLLGRGDMLFMEAGGKIQRLHGPFVSDEEVERIVQHLKAQGEPDYVETITEDFDDFGVGALGDKKGDDEDDLYRQAVDLVRQEKKASTSFIQRRFQIGYNRAARLMEQMEANGVVSTPNHVGKREILGV